VELARALVSQPKLLLLDEPASGLDDDELSAIADLLRQTCRLHPLTVLIVEHHMPSFWVWPIGWSSWISG
jgi:branched-chain amino acid transport system ATP-binding protein